MDGIRRLRLLLIVVGFAAGLALLRSIDLWHGVAMAQETQGTAPTGNAPEPQPKAAGVGNPATAGEAQDLSADGSEQPTDVGPGGSDEAGSPDVRDIADYSDSELEILRNLSARHAELEDRSRRLDVLAEALTEAEARIDEKVGRLQSLKVEIEASLDKYDSVRNERVRNLIKVYESMKAKDAARIFNEMEMDDLLQVFEGMRAQTSAKILAAMDSDMAQRITTELIARGALPPPAES